MQPYRHGPRWGNANSARTGREPRVVCARSKRVICTPGCSTAEGSCVTNAIDQLGGSTKKAAPPRRRIILRVVPGTQKKKRAQSNLWTRVKNNAFAAARGNVLPVRACSVAINAGARASCAKAMMASTGATSAG